MQSFRAFSVVILSILFGLTIVDCGSGNSSPAASAPVEQPAQPSGPTSPNQPTQSPAPTPAPQGATFTVLHDFNCNGQDGTGPGAGLSTDQSGNLYGTTEGGGTDGLGTVFKLTNMGSSWDYAVLYNFQGNSDGSTPEASVSVTPDGTLYGTTAGGGNTNCSPYCGTVFTLTPPLWTETSVFHFSPGGGTWPRSGLVFDQAGNIYGTTFSGGNACLARGCGVVYQLTPSGSGWTESVLHKFTLTLNGTGDGVGPVGGVVFDQAGNLYGATGAGGGSGCGGLGCGAIYELTPSGGGWT